MPAPTPAPPLIDAPAGTPSLRTLGTTAVQACAGNDPRLGAGSTQTWLEEELTRGKTLAGFSDGEFSYFFDEFYSTKDWAFDGNPSARQPVFPTTEVGGVMELSGNNTYAHGLVGLSFADTKVGRLFKLNGKFFLSWRAKLVTPASANANLYQLLGGAANTGAGSIYAGTVGPVSLTKFSAHPAVGSDMLSVANIDNAWHKFNYWSDGTNYKFSVDEETPIVGPLTSAQPSTVMCLYLYTGNNAAWDARYDKVLCMFPLPT